MFVTASDIVDRCSHRFINGIDKFAIKGKTGEWGQIRIEGFGCNTIFNVFLHDKKQLGEALLSAKEHFKFYKEELQKERYDL